MALYNPLDELSIKTRSLEKIDDLTISSKFKIVTVGRLVAPKGYDRLLKVHKQLIDEEFNYELWIIGEGSRRKELEKYISDNNLNESVRLLGFKENPYKYIKECDLFVCSSRVEGFSLAIAEAFILGLPVISTDCSGPNELLDFGTYGLLTENNDMALYEGLKQLLSDKKKLDYYKKQALERGSQFNLKKSIEEIQEVFN